jgi:hypothetical protein
MVDKIVPPHAKLTWLCLYVHLQHLLITIAFFCTPNRQKGQASITKSSLDGWPYQGVVLFVQFQLV